VSVYPTDIYICIYDWIWKRLISIGALCAGPIGDWLGRRWGLIFSCGVFSVGAALQTAATAIPLFVVGRLIAGLGVGLVSALVPLYQSETAPKRIRGTVVGMYQLCIVSQSQPLGVVPSDLQ
jgi:MFS family permease